MTWLLDTNVCVNYLRSGGGSSIARRLAEKNAADVMLCSVVKAELVFGALRSREAAANLAKVGQFTAAMASTMVTKASRPSFGPTAV